MKIEAVVVVVWRCSRCSWWWFCWAGRCGMEDLQDRVNHNHSRRSFATSSSGRGEVFSCGDHIGRVTNLYVGTDKPEAERAGDGRDDGRVAATPDVDERTVEDDGCDGLDETVDAGVEGDVSNTQGTEESGRVIVDSCCRSVRSFWGKLVMGGHKRTSSTGHVL